MRITHSEVSRKGYFFFYLLGYGFLIFKERKSMDLDNLQTTLEELTGGLDNIISSQSKGNILHLKVKDRSLVALDAIEELEVVVSVKMTQNRLRIQLIKKYAKEDGKMAGKVDFSQLAKTIVENVGGKGNINSLRHCITRLRFRLKDESLANKAVLENTEGVISVVQAGGEYMVVIGNDVAKAYNAVNDVLGIADGAMAGESDSDQKQGNPVMRVINSIVGAIMPALNFICAGGVLKGVLSLLSMMGLIQAEDGLYIILNAMGDAVFFFLPMFLGYNFAKHLKGDPFLGMVIGAILCYPAVNGVDLNIFGINVNSTYTSSFLPVIAMVALAVPIERFLKKYISSVVSGFLVPVLTLLAVIPLGFAIIGPVVISAGNAVNSGLAFLLQASPILAGIAFGGLYQVMVLFGIHSAATSMAFINVLEGNPDQIMAMGVLTCFAQIGAVLAVYLKTKDRKVKGVALPAIMSGLFGITEPAIYGVTLPRIKTFVASCIGASVMGAFVMMTGISMYSFTGLGVVTFLGLVSPENPNFILPIIAALIGFVISFILAFVVFKDEVTVEAQEIDDDQLEEKEDQVVEVETNTLVSPLSGEIVELSQVPDQVFASGVLGQGVAIQPEVGRVVAPADGVVTVLMPSKHAVGLTLKNGTEVLIHVGIDTVNLDGQFYQFHVQQDQEVKIGDELITFDIKGIQDAGYNPITPITITNTAQFDSINTLAQGHIEAGQLLLDLS